MRIQISGECEAIKGLRGLLSKAGFQLVEMFPTYSITLHESDDADCIVVDGVDSELERQVVNCIAELSPSGRILLQRGGGNQSDRTLILTLPVNDAEQWAAQQGILRGLLKQVEQKGGWRRWFARG